VPGLSDEGAGEEALRWTGVFTEGVVVVVSAPARETDNGRRVGVSVAVAAEKEAEADGVEKEEKEKDKEALGVEALPPWGAVAVVVAVAFGIRAGWRFGWLVG